jgi:NAD(P)-dependent dehydrogenase (short-subunit alcohol dehydrogenase family)
MQLDFTDKTIFLTGAGGGLGGEVARSFANSGGRVVLTDMDEQKMHEVSQQISATGNACLSYRMDVSQRAQVEGIIKEVEGKWGVPDVLVNAAGVITRGSFLENTDEDWDRSIGVNLKGSWICSQLLARRMVALKKEGAIVNFGSVTSEIVDANQVIYAITKGGVRTLTKSLAIALAPYRIRVNAVGPGTIRTPLNSRFMDENPAVLQARLRRTPLGRLGSPQDVAGAVLFLASDLARYITGITLFIEGGRLSQNTGPVPGDPGY